MSSMSDYNSGDQVYYAPYDAYPTKPGSEREERSFIERHKWLITLGALAGLVVVGKYIYDHMNLQISKGPRIGEVAPGTDTSDQSWVINIGGAPPLASRRPSHVHSFGRGLPSPVVYDQRLYTSEAARLDRPFYMSAEDFKTIAAMYKGGASSLNLDSGSAASIGPSAAAAALSSPSTMTMAPMTAASTLNDASKAIAAAQQQQQQYGMMSGYNFPDQASAEKCKSFASDLMAHLSNSAVKGGKFDQQTFMASYDDCFRHIGKLTPGAAAAAAANSGSPAGAAGAALAAANK